MYGHSWGIHGKEEWGEKPSCTPEDLIERDLRNDEEQFNLNCPEKQKLNFRLDVKKYSSVIVKLRLERSESNHILQESLFLQTLKILLGFPHTVSMFTGMHTAHSSRKWGEADLILSFHMLLVEGGLFPFKLCIYIHSQRNIQDKLKSVTDIGKS